MFDTRIFRLVLWATCGVAASGSASAQQAVAPLEAAAALPQPEFSLPEVVVKEPKRQPAAGSPASASQNGGGGSSQTQAKKKVAKKKKQPSPDAVPSVASSSSNMDEEALPLPEPELTSPASGYGLANSATRNAVGPGSAGRSEISSRIVEQVTTVDEVTAVQIQQSGAKTLDEAINLLPGLYVRNGADGVPRIDIRGLRTRNVQLLLDGVPMNSTFDGQFDPRAIPVENIARIEVTRGGSSVLYGPGGNAAVINIVTKSAAPGLHGTAEAEVGGPKRHRESVTASYGSDKVKMFGSASHYDQDYFNLSDDFNTTTLQSRRRRVNSDREDRSLYANMSYEASPWSQFGLSIGYREGEYGKPVSTVAQNESIFARRTRFERVDDYDSLSIQGTALFKLSPNFTVRPSLFYNKLNELTNGFDDLTFSTQDKNGALHEDASTDIWGGGVQLAYKMGQGNLLTLALDGRNEGWDSDGFSVSGSKNKRTDFDQSHDIQVYSTALEYEMRLTERLSGVVGGGWASQHRDQSNDGDYTYLAGLRYAITDLTALRGSVARKIRFPTLRDLFEVDRGNPDLNTERTQNYEIAIDQALPSINALFTVALFRIDAKDFIEADENGIVQNYDQYRFQGVETTLRWTPTDRLQVLAGYTFMDSKNRSADAGTKELQNRPEHKATLSLNYVLGHGLAVNASYLYIAGSKVLARTGGSGGGGGGGGGGGNTPTSTPVMQLGDYHVVNLGMSYDLLPDGKAQLFGRVENILDEDYEHSFGFPEPGRSAYVGLRAKF